MKFLIVEPSPLPILIPLGPKYSPQDPVFKNNYITLPLIDQISKYLFNNKKFSKLLDQKLLL